MPNSGLAEVIRYIHKVFKSPKLHRTDRELLERFLTHREENAFSVPCPAARPHDPQRRSACTR